MANSSEKKAIQTHQWYKQNFIGISAAIHLFYFLVRVFYRWESFYFKDVFGYLILTGVNVAGLYFLLAYLALGHPTSSYSYLVDILVINWVVLFGVTFSNWFWLLYLSIPGYLFYNYGHYLTGFLKQRNENNMMMQQMQAQMQQEHAASKDQKQKIKYIRR